MALYGIYGRHEISDCPLNNEQTAKRVTEAAKADLSKILPKYEIQKVLGQYHSGLEHTFLWIFEANDPHLIQKWAVDSGIAKFNEVKIVPLMTFGDVAKEVARVYNN